MHSFSEYKGNRLIVLSREGAPGYVDKYPFSFGKAKAQLIVENYEAVKAFAMQDEQGGARRGAPAGGDDDIPW